MVARPVQLRPGARTPTQPHERNTIMGAIAERVAAALAAETSEAVTYCLSADIYPDLFWEIVEKRAR